MINSQVEGSLLKINFISADWLYSFQKASYLIQSSKLTIFLSSSLIPYTSLLLFKTNKLEYITVRMEWRHVLSTFHVKVWFITQFLFIHDRF